MVYSDGSVDLLVEVGARDLNNYTLPCAGKEIDIALLWNGSSIRSMRAVYSEQSQMYYAEIRLVKVGRYSIDITTPLGTQTKANFTVQCKDGYEVSADAECTNPRTECVDTIQWRDPTTKRCRQKPAVAVSGSSTDVSITVVKTIRTKTNSGTVQVRLTSGDIDPSAPVRWTVVLPPNKHSLAVVQRAERHS
jgi:hypothetical protein